MDKMECPYCKKEVEVTHKFSGIICLECKKIIIDKHPWIKWFIGD
jgi:hypothetical protein